MFEKLGGAVELWEDARLAENAWRCEAYSEMYLVSVESIRKYSRHLRYIIKTSDSSIVNFPQICGQTFFSGEKKT